MRTQGNKKETVTQYPITYDIDVKINSSEVLPEHEMSQDTLEEKEEKEEGQKQKNQENEMHAQSN